MRDHTKVFIARCAVQSEDELHVATTYGATNLLDGSIRVRTSCVDQEDGVVLTPEEALRLGRWLLENASEGQKQFSPREEKEENE